MVLVFCSHQLRAGRRVLAWSAPRLRACISYRDAGEAQFMLTAAGRRPESARLCPRWSDHLTLRRAARRARRH